MQSRSGHQQPAETTQLTVIDTKRRTFNPGERPVAKVHYKQLHRGTHFLPTLTSVPWHDPQMSISWSPRRPTEDSGSVG
jgi:hypothetical protein